MNSYNNLYLSIHLVIENIVNGLYNKNVDEDIVNFCKFLKLKNLHEMKEFYERNEKYMAAVRKVEELSTDPEFIGYYDVEEAHKQDIEDAKEQSKIEIAKNMLKDEMPLGVISKYTGLSLEEIENLK